MKNKVTAGILTAIPETMHDMEMIVKFVRDSSTVATEKTKRVYKKRRALYPCQDCRRVMKFKKGLERHRLRKHPELNYPFVAR